VTSSSRQFTPDLLKAIAIFGVVYIHTYPMFANPLADVFRSLARMAVPVFIILWAYFFEKAFAKTRPKIPYILKKWGHLAVVFVSWSLIYLAFKESWTMPTVASWLVRHFSGGAWPGQYFFLILLQLIPFFWLLRKLYEIKWCRYSLLFVAILSYFILGYAFEELPYVIRKLSLRPLLYHVPYVFLGIALARGILPATGLSTGNWLIDTLLAFLVSSTVVGLGLCLARCLRVARLNGILN
jgi:surface polysaccharide O-acyltransferase-like enzyme